MLVVHILSVVFFFQAEDGIRDLVRSRGLGDVYKRQGLSLAKWRRTGHAGCHALVASIWKSRANLVGTEAVSYTHLTLPTSDLV